MEKSFFSPEKYLRSHLESFFANPSSLPSLSGRKKVGGMHHNTMYKMIKNNCSHLKRSNIIYVLKYLVKLNFIQAHLSTFISLGPTQAHI